MAASFFCTQSCKRLPMLQTGLFDLKGGCLSYILEKWVDLPDLACLDSALCTSLFRAEYLSVIGMKEFSNYGSRLMLSEECWKWLLCRNLRISVINLSNYNECKLTATVIEVVKRHSHIDLLEMRHCPNLEFVIEECCQSVGRLDLFASVDMTDGEFLTLTDRVHDLTGISVSNCETLTEAGLITFVKRHGGLQTFNIALSNTETMCTEKVYIALAEHCPRLRKLVAADNLTDKALIKIAKGCPRLETLNINECRRVTDLSVVAVAEKCPRLKKLHASKVKKLTDVCVIRLAECCPDLVLLDVEGCVGVTDRSMVLLAKTHPRMRMLILYDCPDLTSAFITAVAKHCPLLTHLYLTGCAKITDSAVVKLAQGCACLQVVFLNGSKKVTDKGVSALLAHCPHLLCLNTSGTAATDEPLLLAAHDIEYLELDATGTDYIPLPLHDQRPYDLHKEDVDYTSKMIRHTTRTRVRSLISTTSLSCLLGIAAQSPTLHTLKLSMYLCGVDDAIAEIVTLCPLLRSVSIMLGVGLSVKSYLLVAEKCANLTSLEVRCDLTLLDEDVAKVLSLCGGRLRHLSVEGCDRLTDVALQQVGEHCPDLTSLCVSDCTHITDSGMKIVLHRCTGLERVAMSGCEDEITEDTLYEMCMVCTRLRYLDVRRCFNIDNVFQCVMKLLMSCPTLRTVIYLENFCFER